MWGDLDNEIASVAVSVHKVVLEEHLEKGHRANFSDFLTDFISVLFEGRYCGTFCERFH